MNSWCLLAVEQQLDLPRILEDAKMQGGQVRRKQLFGASSPGRPLECQSGRLRRGLRRGLHQQSGRPCVRQGPADSGAQGQVIIVVWRRRAADGWHAGWV